MSTPPGPAPLEAGPNTSSRAAASPTTAVRVGVTAAVCAVVANLLALLVGRLAGADMVVGQPGEAAQTVGPVPVVVATLVGLVVGTALLVLLRNRRRRAWSLLAIAGLLVAIVSALAPLSMAAETDTRVTLAALHVITGLAWFVVVSRAARA